MSNNEDDQVRRRVGFQANAQVVLSILFFIGGLIALVISRDWRFLLFVVGGVVGFFYWLPVQQVYGRKPPGSHQ